MNDIERASMNSVVVDKAKLIETLKSNRDKHKATYDAAVIGYREQAVRILLGYIDKIRDGKVEQVEVDLPVPEDHTSDYDSAITKLEWSLLETVELSSRDFETYIQDNWNWKQDFMRMSAGYTSNG